LYDKKALELLDIDVIDGVITFKENRASKIRTINSSIKESSTIDLNTDLNSTEEEKLASVRLRFSRTNNILSRMA
jgi:hypothetical protein